MCVMLNHNFALFCKIANDILPNQWVLDHNICTYFLLTFKSKKSAYQKLVDHFFCNHLVLQTQIFFSGQPLFWNQISGGFMV